MIAIKAILAKTKVLPLLLLAPIACIFEVTGESYIEKVFRNYKYLIDILKM